ncbi:leucine-rich repeat domain-containing protein [Nocardioides sp. Y6]|uniref:Leucine-rich repeat domain-containing protein n=1 Tax=Nocardioides malaquae TaxID=2773426 RepID=A0ABR9RRH3_9ACTN|nr:leucine-rich repeat domain-containing protein [Nocardioides malaquae]MBE7324175.1 leucine-rich repeat domain-containing protein [Nocardioides malaquae]
MADVNSGCRMPGSSAGGLVMSGVRRGLTAMASVAVIVASTISPTAAADPLDPARPSGQSAASRAATSFTLSPTTTTPGGKVTAKGKVPTKVKGKVHQVRRPVIVQTASGRKWTKAATGRTTKKGTYLVTFTAPVTSGVWKVRVTAPKKKIKGKVLKKFTTTSRTLTITSPTQRGCSVTGELPRAECEALVAIDTANPTANLGSGWGTGTDPCTWDGVTCETGHVAGLDLNGTQLTALPAEVEDLTHLTHLDLYDNQLVALPAQIGSLSHLIYLSLGGNQLAALPAEIWNLTQLTSLGLDGNRLAAVPAEIGNLADLTYLDLYGNQLTALPPEIWNLTDLTHLFLGDNQLTAVPLEIANLTHLTGLHLGDNDLAGDVTEWAQPLMAADTISELALDGNGCLTTTDPAVAEWLTDLESGWDDGCTP